MPIAPIAAPVAGAVGPAHHVALGPMSAPDVKAEAQFQAALDRLAGVDHGKAGQPAHGLEMPASVKGMFNTLDNVNVQAKSISDYASMVEKNGGTLTPGEMINMTMKCQEFMFQCQLTSNIANRGTDGLQQLFRQQG